MTAEHNVLVGEIEALEMQYQTIGDSSAMRVIRADIERLWARIHGTEPPEFDKQGYPVD